MCKPSLSAVLPTFLSVYLSGRAEGGGADGSVYVGHIATTESVSGPFPFSPPFPRNPRPN